MAINWGQALGAAAQSGLSTYERLGEEELRAMQRKQLMKDIAEKEALDAAFRESQARTGQTDDYSQAIRTGGNVGTQQAKMLSDQGALPGATPEDTAFERASAESAARALRENAVQQGAVPADKAALPTMAPTEFTKAQAMDVLSSMANLAGYKAVIIASYYAKKIFPMMMTAAGTIVPAKVLILGVGVAGLQAIATAKRLGAVVSAYDVRAEVKEQVESLGAKFVVLPLENASTASGYAKTMDAAYYQKQQALLQAVVQVQDVVITTANIPGKKAPILLTKAMVEALSPGSVIVDLAAERGGNCELTQLGKVIDHQGVTIVGIENVPAQLAYNAAALYSKNMVTFIDNLIKTTSDGFQIQWQDDIVQATLLTKEGQLVHPQATQWLTKGGN
jgi:NAD/NADP transhydrogenase alpha subunit